MQLVTATIIPADAPFLAHRQPDISASALTKGPGPARGTSFNAMRINTALQIAHRKIVVKLVGAIVTDIEVQNYAEAKYICHNCFTFKCQRFNYYVIQCVCIYVE